MWPESVCLPGYTRISFESKPMSSGHRSKRLRMLEEYPFCFWCGYEVDEESSSCDHVIPKVKGGTSRRGNLVLSCDQCNNTRGSLDPWQFYMKKQPKRVSRPARRGRPIRSKCLHTIDTELKDWLESESEDSGRSVSWLIENAVLQWRRRIEYSRSRPKR